MKTRQKNGLNGGHAIVSAALVNAVASRIERGERDARDARAALSAGDKVRARCAWQRVESLLGEVEEVRTAMRTLGIDPSLAEGVVGTRATHLRAMCTDAAGGTGRRRSANG